MLVSYGREEILMPVAESAMVKASDRLIFPLDVPSVDAAKEWVERLDGIVSVFKIGLELYAASGFSLVPFLTESGKKVFLDLKYYDIPETVEGAVRRVADLGATFLTIHGNPKIVKAAVKARGSSNLKLLAVTVLTSFDNDDMKDMGFERTVEELVLLRAQKAFEAGCDGVICSPQEAGLIRNMTLRQAGRDGAGFLIVTPGVRPSGSSKDTHRRLSTPSDAIKAGADYLIVGRPIREAANPRGVAEAVVAEMRLAFEGEIG
jgi:orotidine-5'-phosphate decarboxylase